MAMIDSEPTSARVPRWGRQIAVVVVAVAVIAGVWVATAPDAVVSPGATVGMPLEVGESGYVGEYALSDRDLRVESIEPVTVGGLAVDLWVCDPAPGQDAIGAVTSERLPEHCVSVEPFVPGTTLAGRPPGARATAPYLLIEVTPTEERPQGLCGLDVTYRLVDGWRTGRRRVAGSTRVVVNEGGDETPLDEGLMSECDPS